MSKWLVPKQGVVSEQTCTRAERSWKDRGAARKIASQTIHKSAASFAPSSLW